MVVLGARREARLTDLRRELGDDVAVARRTDVTSGADVASLVRLGVERFGRLDAVFVNAGVGPGGPLLTTDPAEWDDILRTNVFGAALTIRHAAEQMLRQGDGGDVVVTSSTVGRIVYEQHPIYTASKFAVGALATAVRRELEGKVRVTLIEPGEVKTEFTAEVAEHHLTADQVADTVVWCISQPAEVALHEILLTHTRQRL